MIRLFHRWIGVPAAVILCVIALTGVGLAFFPVNEALQTSSAHGINVGDLAARVQAAQPTVEQIRRSPSGRFTAFYFEGDQPASAVIDPQTGKAVGPADTSSVQRWLTSLHRSLLLGDAGRIVSAGGAVAMFILSLSGILLLKRRAGGWLMIFRPVRGQGQGRLHSVVSRLALPGLVLSSLTALLMSASTFGLIPEGDGGPSFPQTVSGRTGADPATMPKVQMTPADEMISLSFPVSSDATDVYTLKTSLGEGYLDQGTGELVAWADAGWTDQLLSFVRTLHTGQGMAWLAVLSAASALSIPLLSWTGVASWLAGRSSRRLKSHPAELADTVVLFASEGGTTAGFANTLHAALVEQGLKVHLAPMTRFDPPRWAAAKRIILLAATYGDGAAPSIAQNFLGSLQQHDARPNVQLAVLGFGDRSFPSFCGFAAEVARVAQAKGWKELLPFDTVDRQSPQDFARWGQHLSEALGLTFELNHVRAPAQTMGLTLISRRDYGAEVQAPTSILRFAFPKTPYWKRILGNGVPNFQAGDLVGIVPEGSDLPRFYSLASGKRDGFLEICVRRHAGGLCSGQLTSMEPGDTIKGFVRSNPSFRPARGKKPVILIGAGTGIGPLAGFARANSSRRPMHLYFGLRHPGSDALYSEELATWTEDGRMSSVCLASSRSPVPAYVQDVLLKDAKNLRRLLGSGAQILVCGGREMASGVASAISDILAGQGLSLAELKAEGRYAEDVY